MSSYGVRAHTARKNHRADCGHGIKQGERYLSHVEFPGGDAGYADAAGHPVRMKECAGCATRYDRGHLLELKPNDGATQTTTHWARTTSDTYAGKTACGQLLMTGQGLYLMLESVNCGPCLKTANREGKTP